jgi:PST family polysaccharide transporter
MAFVAKKAERPAPATIAAVQEAEATAPGASPPANATLGSAGGRVPIRAALSLSMLNTVVGKAGTFLTGIVLAHLLAPADFGVYAVALVALTGLLAFNELGVSLALVRWQGDPRQIAPTVATISLAFSVVLYVGSWVAAPPFAEVLHAPAAAGIIRLLCLSVVIDGLTSVPVQLLNRDFRQGVRLLVDMVCLLVTTAVTVALAATHHGPWSLAWGMLVGNALSALVMFQLSGTWPRFGFDRGQARELLRFGFPLAAASALVFAILNLDYVVTGRMLGATALGLYLLAFNLASWPVNVFSQVMRRVSLAAFARVQDDRVARQEALTRMASLLAAATLPVCVLLGLLAFPAVNSVYGTRWGPAAAALPFLAILGAVRVGSELAYDFLVGVGRSRATLWLQALWFAALCVALPLGASADGIRGVAVAHASVALAVMLPAYALVLRRTDVSIGRLARHLGRPVVACVFLALTVIAVRTLTGTTTLCLVLASILGIAVYAPVVWPLRRIVGSLDQPT